MRRTAARFASVWCGVALIALGCGGSDDDGASLIQDGSGDAPHLDAVDTHEGDDDTVAPPDGANDTDPAEDTAEPTDGVTDPDAPEDTTTSPDAVDPDALDPDVVDPDAADPDAADPDVVDPDVVDPDADPGDATDAISDADTDPGDTSEPGPACPIYQRLCDGVCVNTNANPDHCGGCDVTCPAGQVCSAGGCAGGCLPGLEACGGTCVDTLTDSVHCGGCDAPCPAGQGCVNGDCRPSIALEPPDHCVDFGPIVIDDGAGDVCLGDQAQTTFTWAICSCGNISTTNEVVTDAYDSTQGPWTPGGTGGGIGLNGAFSATNKLTIGGTLWSASANGAHIQNETTIAHEVHVGGPLHAQNTTHIGRDAHVAGNVTASGGLTIAGTLFQPPGATTSGPVTWGDRVTDQPVSVPPPCRCGPDELIPVVDIVAAHASDNDNDLVGLASNALMNPGGDVHLALPCGRFYLDGISTSNKMTVIATGRVALFIAGNIASSNDLQITVAPGAELDVFVAGTFVVSNKLRLGSANFPALMRVYLGSTGGVSLNNNTLVGAYIYAAHGPVTTFNQIEIFGGLFAGSMSSSNKVTVHYDRAILGAGQDCAPPPPDATCQGCEDCGNQACVEGTCGACAVSADCCSPLVCVDGQCLSLGIIID